MRSFRIGSALGVPVQLDLTFLLVLPLFAWLIGARIEGIVPALNALPAADVAADELTRSPLRWALGLVAAVGLFVGVLLHEFGHALVTRRFGYPVESITLWLFGGIARLTEIPDDWTQELAIAIAGPAVSVALGALAYAGFAVVPSGFAGTRFVLGYLATLNVALAAFNLLPAFPMDGGRMLRALLARSRPYAAATRTAAEIGKLFAILFGLVGLVTFQILLIGIAFFVYIAAAGEAEQVTVRSAFDGVEVADIMTPAADLHTVAPDTSVAALLERMFRERHTGYPVVQSGHPVGVVTLEDAQSVADVEREAFTVADVMTEDLVTVGPTDPVLDAMDRMQEGGVGRLLVVEGDEVVGLVSRTDLKHALNVLRSTDVELSEQAPGAG